MLDLTIHRFILRYREHVVGHFSNVAIAVLTGYTRCSFSTKRRAEMLAQYTIEERGTEKWIPITDHTVDYVNGSHCYRGEKVIN